MILLSQPHRTLCCVESVLKTVWAWVHFDKLGYQCTEFYDHNHSHCHRTIPTLYPKSLLKMGHAGNWCLHPAAQFYSKLWICSLSRENFCGSGSEGSFEHGYLALHIPVLAADDGTPWALSLLLPVPSQVPVFALGSPIIRKYSVQGSSSQMECHDNW